MKRARATEIVKKIISQHAEPNLVTAQIDLLRKVTQLKPHFGHGQEDIHEGLTFLLETFPKEVRNLFLLRIEDHVVCKSCRKIVNKTNDENFCYEFYGIDPNIKTPEAFGKALLRKIEDLDTYKCDTCKEQKCFIIHSLVRAPEILCIIFNKFAGKYQQYFPEKMELPVKPKPLTYRLIGQAEHSGGQGGGHYWARCKRDDKVYICNDGSVSANSFVNTAETYAVFYELVKK